MRVNVYLGSKLLEENKYFRSLDSAWTYCKYVCPRIYGGNASLYNPVIVSR